MKNTVILILSSLLLFFGNINALGACSKCASEPVKHESIVINIMGKPMNTDVVSQNINQTVLIPARATFECIGYETTWNSVKNIAIFNDDTKKHTIQLKLGDKNIIVDEKTYVLPHEIIMKDDRLLVAPEVLEKLGYWWQWNPNELILNINEYEWTEP